MNLVNLTGRLKSAPQEVTGKSLRVKQVGLEIRVGRPNYQDGEKSAGEDIIPISFFGDARCDYILRRKFKTGQLVACVARLVIYKDGSLNVVGSEIIPAAIPDAPKPTHVVPEEPPALAYEGDVGQPPF